MAIKSCSEGGSSAEKHGNKKKKRGKIIQRFSIPKDEASNFKSRNLSPIRM